MTSTFAIVGIDDEIPVGKYQTLTVRECLKLDPDYLRWFAESISDYELETDVLEALDDEGLRLELIEDGNFE